MRFIKFVFLPLLMIIGRNAGLAATRQLGSDWNLVIDGNAFLFESAFNSIVGALNTADDLGLTYVSMTIDG